MLFQDECRRKGRWDEPLLEHNNTAWKEWLKDLLNLASLRVPQCYKIKEVGRAVSVQLLTCCDASQAAYGMVSYLRVTDDLGRIHCSFLYGRAKLAPLKQQTIPRLELCAAVLAVNVDRMREELTMDIKKSFFWTGSILVLQYLANASRRFHTFVANRVAMIQELSEMKRWRRVGKSMNPEDDESRGLSLGNLIDVCRWIQAPVFLWKVEEQTPEKPRLPLNLSGDMEVKQTLAILATGSLATRDTQTKNALYILWARYSNWPYLLRGVAWLRRFIKWLENIL
ncbi:uncharacterized protein LOC121870386 [Homarus americanus]|uniref:uncharacterized protein LOC121870386 n=1 Tax=Homarus americanus TaxID=6706 RepID=UPI001C46A82F|nr:uncharacterized protein LOC121870386 [Homarus americanus]